MHCKKIFLPFYTLIVFMISCKTGDDRQSQLKKLNEQSLACIRTMNSSEEKMNAALAAGDHATAEAMQKTMDSAARENVKIGQQISELNSK